MNAAGKLAAILAADVAGYSRLGPLTAQPRRQGTPPNDRSPPIVLKNVEANMV